MSLTNTIFDMVYYINLDKDEDRNANMLSYFEKFGIKNFTRMPGVAVDVDQDQIPYNAYRNFNKKDEKYIKSAIGCRISHLKCIEDAKVNSYKKILIFEDDVQFSKDINDLLLGNYNALENFDMIYLGGLVEQQFRNQIVTTHAYGLSEGIYDDILSMAIASGMEIDNFYAKILQHMSVNNRQGGQYIIKKIEPFNSVYQDRVKFTSNFE
jgi:GR25 family glycosyltransferase involved in LPS biosynthesis